MSIKEQIKSFREELGIDSYRMSRDLGRAHNHIWRIERGAMNPSFESLIEIAEYFRARGKNLQLVDAASAPVAVPISRGRA